MAVGSCKNSDVDLREQYAGTYNVTASTLSGSITGSIKTTFDIGNDVLIVTKSSDSNDIYLSFTKNRFTATLDKNGAFFLPPQAEQAYAVNGTSFGINYGGSGAFTNDGIYLNISMNASVSGSKIEELTTIKGTKR